MKIINMHIYSFFLEGFRNVIFLRPMRPMRPMRPLQTALNCKLQNISKSCTYIYIKDGILLLTKSII